MEFRDKDFVVYTSLIGNNEGLNSQPFLRKSNLRHICFTDDKHLFSEDWEIIYVENILPLDFYRSQRNFKIRPHLILDNYKYSLYIDNTVVFKKTPEEFINMIINSKNLNPLQPFVCLPYHSQFNLIEEFNACSENSLDDQLKIFEQLSDYIKISSENLKRRAYWCGILLRNHNNKIVKSFSEIWFTHICRYSRRDQLSVIHAALQAGLDLRGFELENDNSDFHKWPITKKKRTNRKFQKKYVDLIPLNYLEKLDKLKIKGEDKSKKTILKFLKSFLKIIFLKLKITFKTFLRN